MNLIKDINDSALEGDRAKFEFQLNSGHSIENKKSIYAATPIHNSVKFANDQRLKDKNKKSDTELLHVIIQCGANIDSTDSNGWSPQHRACENGDQETVVVQLNHGADYNLFSNKGYYPIHIAAMNNHHGIVEILHERGANLDVSFF